MVSIFDDDTACDILAHCAYYEVTVLFPEILRDLPEYLEMDDSAGVLVIASLFNALVDEKYVEGLSDEELPVEYRKYILGFLEQHQASWDAMDKGRKKELLDGCSRALDLMKDEKTCEVYEEWKKAGTLDEWMKVLASLKSGLEIES